MTEYSCHGRWTENDTNFLITTPQSRTSIGAKRYCFIYKEVGSIIHFSSSSQSCVRNINTGVEGVLAFNATKIGMLQNDVQFGFRDFSGNKNFFCRSMSANKWRIRFQWACPLYGCFGDVLN